MIRQLLDLKSKAAIGFICPVCLKLPKNPVKCQIIACQGIFCFDCVKANIGKTYQCPYRCSIGRIFQIQDLNQFELSYFDNFDSICNFCNQKFRILKYRNHNDKCENKINKKLNQNYGSGIRQQKLCQYCNQFNEGDSFNCIRCNLQIKIQFSENCHIALYDKQCELCRQFFNNITLDTHIQNYCLGYQVQCEICQISLLRKNYNDHSKSCIKLQKNKLQQDQIYYAKIQHIITFNILQKSIDMQQNFSKCLKILKKIAKYKQERTDDES